MTTTNKSRFFLFSVLFLLFLLACFFYQKYKESDSHKLDNQPQLAHNEASSAEAVANEPPTTTGQPIIERKDDKQLAGHPQPFNGAPPAANGASPSTNELPKKIVEKEKQLAGHFQSVNGEVSLITGNLSKKIMAGASFNSGDKIITGKQSSARIKMQDNGIINIRQETELDIASFEYHKNPGTDKVIFNLIRGAFRSVTGLIGNNNKKSYLVTTPTATIGVRGTDHEPIYIPETGWSGAPNRTPGTYDQVYSGKTVLTSFNKKELEILPEQTGFAAKDGSKPQLIIAFTDTTVSSSRIYDIYSNQRNAEHMPNNKDAKTIYIKWQLAKTLGGKIDDYVINSYSSTDSSFLVDYSKTSEPNVHIKIKVLIKNRLS